MKIGIIGAENSHSAAIAKTLNIEKQIEGVSVDYIWGETEEFAKAAAEKGQIPNIVKQPADMLGRIEALIVDHRHAQHHLEAARPFLGEKIPMFIDKPFCYRAREGEAFLKTAAEKGIPVTSYSTIPLQQNFLELKKQAAELGGISAAASFGPCDLASPYGGVFFYGIHQVEMALEMCGYDVASVRVTQNGNCSTGQLLYPSGVVATLHFINGKWLDFSMTVVGSKGARHAAIKSDPNPYLTGIRTFVTMFRTGKEPRSHAQILKPIAVLEALERSVKSAETEKVGQ